MAMSVDQVDETQEQQRADGGNGRHQADQRPQGETEAGHEENLKNGIDFVLAREFRLQRLPS